MSKPRTPVLLYAWLVLTRVLSVPIRLFGKRMHRRMGAAAARFPERLGVATHVVESPVIWFHAASLGEVMQIGELAARLHQTEEAQILVTTTTASGADWVAREMPYAVHQFGPLDTPGAVDRFLSAWTIGLAVFVEGDLWPRLILGLRHRGIPRVLLNARHSRSRARFAGLFSTLLRDFSLVTCRSDAVAASVRQLGVPGGAVKTLPDLRIAARPLPIRDDVVSDLAPGLEGRPVWLAASTHPKDEAAVLDAHRELLRSVPDALLILAPRHPKRGDPLEESARGRGFEMARRSRGEALARSTQLYLADTLGEMGAFFSVADMAFVGGSFGDEGGHNPYEPASFGCAIVSGPHVRNFEDAYQSLVGAGAAVQVADTNRLGDTVCRLFRAGEAAGMGEAARVFMADSQGGLDAHVRLLAETYRAAGTGGGAMAQT